MLEKYQSIYVDLAKQESPMSYEQIWIYQELLYRMEALQVCKMFTANAPVSNVDRDLVTHYQMLERYLEGLKNERRYGPAIDEDKQKQCEGNVSSEHRVIQRDD